MLFLSQSEVKQLLDLDELVDSIAIAMSDLSSGKASMPPRIGALVKEQGGLLGAMPAFSPSLGMLTTKLVSLFPRNADTDTPTHQAVIVAFDPSNGKPIAVMDGTYMTAVRTAAASALSTRLLAREDASVLAILGTGVQAAAHARAIPRVRNITEIRFAGRNLSKAEALASQIGIELGIQTRASGSFEEAQGGAEIVCATTHPLAPVVRWEWLSPGTHVTSVGMSTEGCEVDAETVTRANVFVEQRSAATSSMPTGSNDLFLPVRDGLIKFESLTEIGELVSGLKPGRRSDSEITLYKSVGVAVQDAAAAKLVLEQAVRTGVGTRINL